MRIVLGIEYDGSHFCGWQRQPHASSVQQVVEDALSKVANTPITVQVAGRTDTAVHATEQVVHFDCFAERDDKAWIMGANTNLPSSVAILWCKRVNDKFHARYSAISRRYRYVILNRSTRPAILDRLVTWVYKPLDYVAMSKAANSLIGKHDFSSYRALACQSKSPIRTVHDIKVACQGEFIFIDIHADGFLHHMVRNIVGVLIDIGKGDQEIDWANTVLQYRDRTKGGVTAQAAGLYLVKVQYDDVYGLDNKIKWPVFSI